MSTKEFFFFLTQMSTKDILLKFGKCRTHNIMDKEQKREN